jgi:hypothetical protein
MQPNTGEDTAESYLLSQILGRSKRVTAPADTSVKLRNAGEQPAKHLWFIRFSFIWNTLFAVAAYGRLSGKVV